MLFLELYFQAQEVLQISVAFSYNFLMTKLEMQVVNKMAPWSPRPSSSGTCWDSSSKCHSSNRKEFQEGPKSSIEPQEGLKSASEC